MKNYREGFGFFLKLGRAVLETEDTTEEPQDTKNIEAHSGSTDSKVEPMKVYWETDKQELDNKNQPWIDLYLKDDSLERIPDSTEKPVEEFQYNYKNFILEHLPEKLKNIDLSAVTETPKTGTGISSSGRDAGVVAGIVVAVISGILILAALIAVVMYRHYVHRNVTSMNFDNPVYRKTTEDQLTLEKNGYAPGGKLYPSTVGDETQEPLNTVGTNDFV